MSAEPNCFFCGKLRADHSESPDFYMGELEHPSKPGETLSSYSYCRTACCGGYVRDREALFNKMRPS